MIGVNTVPRPGTIFTSEQCPGDRQFLGGGGGGGGGGGHKCSLLDLHLSSLQVSTTGK